MWATHRELDEGMRVELERLCVAEPPLAAVRADRAPRCREEVLTLLAPAAAEFRGPSYVLPEHLPEDRRAREIDAAEVSAYARVFPWLPEEFSHVAPVVITFAGAEPAAICHAPRGCTARAAEAGVETRAAFRRRGLGAAAVACWARAVRRRGLLALYSTAWENAASQALACRLGARPYGEVWHVS